MRAKLILEEDKNIYQKAYDITTFLIDKNIRNLRYLSSITIPGIYSSLVTNYALGRNNEVSRGMKDALYDFISENIFGGMEPTFETQESYEWWENLSDEYFNEKGELKPEYRIRTQIFEEQ